MKPHHFLCAAAAAPLLWCSSAKAACEGLAGLAAAVGLGVGGASMVVTGFGVSGIAKLDNPRLDYWPGVAYTMGHAGGGVAIGYAVTQVKCQQPVLYAPALSAFGNGLVAAIVWAGSTDTSAADHGMRLTAGPGGGSVVVRF